MNRQEFAQKIYLHLLSNPAYTEYDIGQLVNLSYEMADRHFAYDSQDRRYAPKVGHQD